MRNELISTRPTNWIDLEYCYYLPFCRVFLSDDKIHDSLVPYLIDKNQCYIKGSDIKKDLKRILELKKTSTPEELKAMEREPPRVPDLIIYKIWERMFHKWPPEVTWEPSEEDFKMMHDAINQFRNARPIDEV